MTDNATHQALHDYVRGTLLNGRAVADDENLLLSGMLDSLAVMSLVAFIEETYAMSVPFDDVIIENFMSIAAMEEYVSGKMAA